MKTALRIARSQCQSACLAGSIHKGMLQMRGISGAASWLSPVSVCHVAAVTATEHLMVQEQANLNDRILRTCFSQVQFVC